MTYALFIVLESYIWKIDDVVESISDFGINYNKVKVSLKRIEWEDGGYLMRLLNRIFN